MKKPSIHGLSLAEAIERLKIHDHLCLIYEQREEQFAAIAPFFKAGLARGEKCVYIADENTSQEVLEALRGEIMDVDAALASGALSVITKRDAYLKQGYFDPDSMIRLLKEAVELAKEEGFSGLRVTGEMTWSLGEEPGVEQLVEYEAKLNYFLPQNDILVICQYNAKRFSPEILIDIIRTHPIVIYGNRVCKNFYYVPPDEFLKADHLDIEVRRLLKNIFERELLEQEHERFQEEMILFRALIDQSNDAILVIDPETGKFLDANEKACVSLGYQREELLAMGVPDIEKILPDRPSWEKHVDEVRKNNFMVIEGAHVRKDGDVFPVEVNVRYISLKGKDFLVAIVRDITGRKKAVEELEKAYDELRDKAGRLELFQKVTVGREQEMIRLKKEVNAILAELGRPGKYG